MHDDEILPEETQWSWEDKWDTWIITKIVISVGILAFIVSLIAYIMGF